MYNHHLYFAYWLVNSVVLYALGFIFPETIQLGNGRLMPLESAIYSGFWLTFVVWSMWDYVIVRRARLEPEYVALVYFLLVNTLGVMLIAYLTRFTGLSVQSFWWCAGIALIANILQRQAFRFITSRQRGA